MVLMGIVLTLAVHFLLRDHLDRGFNSTSTYDTLGKNVCEYLVSHVSLTLYEINVDGVSAPNGSKFQTSSCIAANSEPTIL